MLRTCISVGIFIVSEKVKKAVGSLKSFLEKNCEKSISWASVDERFSSKGADTLVKHAESKLDKKKRHSLAAALILEIYLGQQKQ